MPEIQELRQEKEALYRLFAQIGQALASPRRLELVDLLAQAPRTVEELAKAAHMSMANTSQHLQKLKQAQLVVDERSGVHIRYRLADPSVTQLWLQLRTVAEKQLADVQGALDAYRTRRHEFENISVEELRDRLRRGEVVLLDVRPPVEYRAAHLPGARSLALEELEKRLDELPRDLPIVAYCRGPFCVIADEALSILEANGHAVARLEEGVAEWQLAGYSVVSES